MKTKKLLLGCVLLLLVINFVSAERYEDNYFKYGTINSEGILQKTSAKINDVHILGVICSSQNCNSISGYLYNGNILNSSGDYIKLTYPTNLASIFGYGIYIFKIGYIPYEFSADYWGTNPADPQGPYNNYLTRKEVCKSDVTELNATENSGIISAAAKIYSPITNAGPLNYTPDQIKPYYSADVKVIFEVKENDNIIYSENKTVNIEFSGNKTVSFSSPELDAGTYNVSITSVSDDAKCLSSSDKQASKIITIEQPAIECEYDSDCGINGFIENAFCSINDVFQNFITFKCNNPGTQASYCSNLIAPQLIQNCGEDEYGNWNNYCQGNNLYKQRDYSQKGCAAGACFVSNLTQNEFVKTCDYDCVSGECIPEPVPVCGNNVIEQGEECDDGNLINGDGCSSLCKTEQIECCTDDNCHADYYSNDYCSDNDVYKDYHDFFCLLGFCNENITKIFVTDCGNDYCDGFKQNYCKADDVYHSKTCHNKGCLTGGCYNENYESEELVSECSYGCNNGTCNPAPECSVDTDCHADYYSDKYCSSGDVYKDYHDFGCAIGSCSENIIKELVRECDNGCKNGQCKSEDNNEDTWCVETNSCELTFNDSTEFDDSITLKNTDTQIGLIKLNNSETKKPLSYFWVLIIIIAIIIVLIALILIKLI